MENLWKVSGQQLLYFFNLFWVERRVARVQGDRLLITHSHHLLLSLLRKKTHILPAK